MFIAIEGIDCSGKSSLIQELKIKLPKAVFTKDLGGTVYGQSVRNTVLWQELNRYSEILAILSARVDLTEKVILPVIKRGDIVICDRFNLSTYAYQGIAKGFFISHIEKLERSIQDLVYPDLQIILDITAEQALKRLETRASKKDKFEQASIHTWNQVADYYSTLKGDNIVHLSGLEDSRTLADKVLEIIKKEMVI